MAKQNKTHEGFLSSSDVAKRLGIKEPSLRNWRSVGRGPNYIKVGQARNAKVLYKEKDVRAFERAYFKETYVKV